MIFIIIQEIVHLQMNLLKKNQMMLFPFRMIPLEEGVDYKILEILAI